MDSATHSAPLLPDSSETVERNPPEPSEQRTEEEQDDTSQHDQDRNGLDELPADTEDQVDEEEENAVTNNDQMEVEKTQKQTVTMRQGRGITGYMLFLKRNRETIKAELGDGKIGLKDIAKLAAEKWRALSEENRLKWNKEAKLIEPESRTSSDNNAGDEEKLSLPLSKVREIIKMDPDVKSVQALAVKIVAKATEIFAAELSKMALGCGDHKRIRLIDVHHVIHANDDKFGFLSFDFETPAQIVEREEREARRKKAKSEMNSTVVQAAGKQSIASYFGATSKIHSNH